MPRRYLFLLSSARPGGNTEALARRAANSLPADVVQDWRDLSDAKLPPFRDCRQAGGYGPPAPAALALMQATQAATDLVFVAPLYWYGLPASAKLYLDHWTHWMRLPGSTFRADMALKRFWLILTHSGSAPEEIAPAVDCIRFSAAYMKAPFMGTLLGYANAPGEIAADTAALVAADHFFAA
jgi:hypothetical protein